MLMKYLSIICFTISSICSSCQGITTKAKQHGALCMRVNEFRERFQDIHESSPRSIYITNKPTARSLTKEDFGNLAKLSNLESFYIDNNHLGIAEVNALGQSLSKLKRLKALYLRGCYIGRKELQILIDYIASNPSLALLDLSYNNIDDTGGQELAKMLKYNKSLQTLNLSYNPITERGIMSLSLINEFQRNKLKKIIITARSMDLLGRHSLEAFQRRHPYPKIDLCAIKRTS